MAEVELETVSPSSTISP